MSAGLWRHPVALGLAALVLAILAAATFAIVPETQQAVIVRLGQPVAVVNGWMPGARLGAAGPGLIARAPFIDRLVWIDKRLLDVDTENETVTTADGRSLDLDVDAHVRVEQPLRMVAAARSQRGAIDRLRGQLVAAVRDELARRPLDALLGPGRAGVPGAIAARFAAAAQADGVAVADVHIRRADLPAGPGEERVLAMMRDARTRQADAIRAAGRQAALAIGAQADAEATATYARIFGEDPEAYDFYRAMQSYRSAFGPGSKGRTTIVLAPGDAYLRQWESGAK